MTEERDQAMLDALREIRDGQREIIGLLEKQYALTEGNFKQTKETVAQSIELQRIGLDRFRSVSFIAIPGIVACIAAIGYLVVRYF